MRTLTADDLLGFASTLEGEELPTAGGRATFTLRVLPRGIEITPRSSGTARVITPVQIQRFCEDYQQSLSNEPGEYRSMTHNASYLLSVIDRYLRR